MRKTKAVPSENPTSAPIGDEVAVAPTAEPVPEAAPAAAAAPAPEPAAAPPASDDGASAHLKAAIEALVFVADHPLSLRELREALGLEDGDAVRAAVAELARESEPRGVQLVEVGGGWQLRTNPACAGAVQHLLAHRPAQISRPGRETLAIIAYRQPITRAEIEEIRGVDCAGVLKMLLDRGLVRTAGHKEEPGRPLLYVTTKEFLAFFHLRDLRDLPTLREFTELDEEQRARLEEELGPEAGAAAAGPEPEPEPEPEATR